MGSAGGRRVLVHGVHGGQLVGSVLGRKWDSGRSAAQHSTAQAPAGSERDARGRGRAAQGQERGAASPYMVRSGGTQEVRVAGRVPCRACAAEAWRVANSNKLARERA